MKTLSFNSVKINIDNLEVLIDLKQFKLSELDVRYKESKFYSYLELIVPEGKYLIKGLKSIWEMFRISTYDVLEKREDNKVYNLYCRIKDLKEK